MNKVEIIGNLGGDAEVKEIKGNTTVCNFSVAAPSAQRKDDEGKKVSYWYRCAIFGKWAEVMGPLLKKGQQVYVAGDMDVDEWQDKNSGSNRWGLNMKVTHLQILGKKETADGGDAPF